MLSKKLLRRTAVAGFFRRNASSSDRTTLWTVLSQRRFSSCNQATFRVALCDMCVSRRCARSMIPFRFTTVRTLCSVSRVTVIGKPLSASFSYFHSLKQKGRLELQNARQIRLTKSLSNWKTCKIFTTISKFCSRICCDDRVARYNLRG